MSEAMRFVTSVRIPESQLRRIDQAVVKFNERTGMRVGRQAMIRYLMEIGLKEEEKKYDGQATS